MCKNLIAIFAILAGFFSANSQTTVVDSIVHNGVMRNYRLFLPSGFTATASLPLVFNFHGYTSNALQQEAYSGFDEVAENNSVVMCYPNGLNNSWNVLGGTVDDVGFVDTLITLLHDEYNINLNRVYATGMSNGGFMSNLLGCVLAHRIAAIAPVAGTNVPFVTQTCSPGKLVPTLSIHGTADGVVEYIGAIGYSSVAELMQLWRGVNGCSATTDTVLLPDISTTDGSRAEKITWHDCDGFSEVIHYRVIDGGHTWPGAVFTIGVTNHDFVASEVIWEFFNRFTLNIDIDEPDPESAVSIYPNPFTTGLEIGVNVPGKSIVRIFSPDGRLINTFQFKGERFRLNELNVSPGIYFLQIEFAGMSVTKRIVKLNE